MCWSLSFSRFDCHLPQPRTLIALHILWQMGYTREAATRNPFKSFCEPKGPGPDGKNLDFSRFYARTASECRCSRGDADGRTNLCPCFLVQFSIPSTPITRIHPSSVLLLSGESTDALQTSGLSAFTASESYNFILAASLLLSAAAAAHAV